MSTLTESSDITDSAGIAAFLKLPSARTVDNLRRAKKLPAIKIGYRTIRFSKKQCAAALEKLTLNAVGA